MRETLSYGESESCRAAIAVQRLKETAVHPYFVSQLAALHVNDMQAQATAARRARQARRARRGRNAAADRGPQLCQDLSVRTA